MAKKFELNETEDLIVTITLEDAVFIPVDGEKVDVGVYDQTTVQTIKKDKIAVLKKFIEDEGANAKVQLDKFEKQYEPLKDLQDIDEKIIKHCKRAIDKGTKTFKDSMVTLNKRITDLQLKTNLGAQIEYIKKQLGDINSDLESLNKIVK